MPISRPEHTSAVSCPVSSFTKRPFLQPLLDGVLHALGSEGFPVRSLESAYVQAVIDTPQGRELGLLKLLDEKWKELNLGVYWTQVTRIDQQK